MMFRLIGMLLLLAAGIVPIRAQSPDAFVDSSLQANDGLDAARLREAAARLEAARVGVLPDPRLAIGFFLLPVETRVGPQRFKASVTQSFPWFGTLGLLRDRADRMADVLDHRLDARERELALAVRSGWYELFRLQRQVAIARDELGLLEGFAAHVRRRFEVGETGLVDVLRIDLRLAEAETGVANLEALVPPTLAAFNALVGRRPDAPVRLPDTLPALPPPPARLPESWRDHPDLLALDSRSETARLNAQLARKSGSPTIGFGLEYAQVDPRPGSESPDAGQDVVAPVLSLSLPLQRAPYRTAIRQSEFERDALSRESAERIRMLEAEWFAARARLVRARNDLAWHDRQIEVLRSALDILFTAFASGEADFEEVLRLEQDLLRARLDRVTALASAWTAAAEIESLLEQP